VESPTLSDSVPRRIAWRIVSQMSEIDEVDGLSDGPEWNDQGNCGF